MDTETAQQTKSEAIRKRKAEATARWRARNPEKEKASRKKSDSRPERKEYQRLRQVELRKTQSKKDYVKEYRARPSVRARTNERQRTKEHREKQKEWRARSASFKDKRNARMREYRKTARGIIENRMRVAIRRGVKRRIGSIKDLPYTAEHLISHIESLFRDGMSWDNAHLWHIDHVIPLCTFEYESISCGAFKAAWALSNLRPLWAFENLSRQRRRPEDDFATRLSGQA